MRDESALGKSLDLAELMAAMGDWPLVTDPLRTYKELWQAPSTEGWQNKPQRYLYDALHEAAALRLTLDRMLGAIIDTVGGYAK